MLEDTGEKIENPERINVLERRIRDLEALVKGLTDEMLDLKSITRRLSKTYDDRGPYIVRDRTVPERPETVILPKLNQKPQTQPQTPGDIETEKKEEKQEMAMIMGPNGTLHPEERKPNSDYIIASAKYHKKSEEGRREKVGSEKKSMLIIAEEDDLKEKGN